MSDTTLLPCPFCGGEAREVHYSKWGSLGNLAWLIRCTGCHARMTGTHHDMNRAAWNTRAERTCKAENAKLRELVMDMWHELNYTSVRAEDGSNGCLERVLGFDKRMRDLGIEEL